MSQWWQRLRQMQINWLAVIGAAVVLVVTAAIWIGSIQRQTAQTQSKRSERQLELFQKESERDSLQQAVDNVGSDSYITTEARNANMQSLSSIRFRVVNPDQLDKYTEEEWQIILQEQEWDAQ